MDQHIMDRLAGRVASIEQLEHGYRGRVGSPTPDRYFAPMIRNGGTEGNTLFLSRSSSDTCLHLSDAEVVLLRNVLMRHCEDKGL